MSDYDEETPTVIGVEQLEQQSAPSNIGSTINVFDSPLALFPLPRLEHDVAAAKKYLHKVSDHKGTSLYDHLSQLLTKILTERPDNVVEFFEEYSRELKESRFFPEKDLLRDVYMPPEAYGEALRLMPMFEIGSVSDDEGDDDQVEKVVSKVTDVLENSYYFEQAQLTEDEYAKRNAEIDEVETRQEEERSQLTEMADLPESTEEAPKEDDKEEVIEDEEGVKIRELLSKLPPIPQTTFKPPLEVPPERPGSGANKMVYYVCNRPGESWTMLPDVTPQHITVARKIKRFFTGDLATEIQTSPTFPGTEINYLRAQIARISAGTQVSPRGFYHTGQDEEEEEVLDEEGLANNIVENPDYEPLLITDMLDIENWVHHTSHILDQGRVVWWKPPAEGDVEEEEEEKEEEDLDGPLIEEVGPPLLNPLSEDVTLETVPPWNTRVSSYLAPETAVVNVMSNLWPGAYCFWADKKTDNIYLGFGHKFTNTNFTPEPMEPIQSVYPEGPEIMEMDDPTPEEEEAWRLEHAPKEEEGVEEEQEEEEEEEIIEDDD
ncbi:hypothetical protein PR048_004840 [Dryococelus australis]|uniref:Uncharacterized protein n=1 Tax=Dryococelus australis TaxID=614101 RepID=A0ABQ9I6J9_9NEOP|nr:hypothetical protein PR048_004840 [Dryococelus australis]